MTGGAVEKLPRYLRAQVWGVLRPAESALRRLIVVVKERMKDEGRGVTPRAAAPFPVKFSRGERKAVPAFALFDRRKSFNFNGKRSAKGTPNIRFFDGYDAPVPVKVAAMPDDMVSAQSLNRRLAALRNALDDLPKQARRMARVEAKREAAQAQAIARKVDRLSGSEIAPEQRQRAFAMINGHGKRSESGKYIRPVRPGRPPGHRARKRHPVDFVLADCHELALYVLVPP